MSSECTCITNLQSINEYLQEQEDNNEQEQLDAEDIEVVLVQTGAVFLGIRSEFKEGDHEIDSFVETNAARRTSRRR